MIIDNLIRTIKKCCLRVSFLSVPNHLFYTVSDRSTVTRADCSEQKLNMQRIVNSNDPSMMKLFIFLQAKTKYKFVSQCILR